MEVLLGWRLQLDSRPELEPFALRWEDRLLNASRGEQAADGRIRKHCQAVATQKSASSKKGLPPVEKSFFAFFFGLTELPVSHIPCPV